MPSTESEAAVGTGIVTGDQASIPQVIRERADIEDGDMLRWYWDDGDLQVEILRRRDGVFDDFERFEGAAESVDHNMVGVEPANRQDAG